MKPIDESTESMILQKIGFHIPKKKKKKLLAHWPNTPKLIFAVFFRHKQI